MDFFLFFASSKEINALNNLKRTIRSYANVSEEDMEFCLQFYRKEIYQKGEFLLKPSDYSKDFYFVDKGCVSYYTEEKGEVRIMEFFTEGYFFNDLYAYIQETPSNAYLKALEDTSVYVISKKDVQKVFDRSHQFERFGRLSMQRTFVINFQRVNQLKTLSNQERYLRLLEKRPDLFQRVPQYLIASYLGITPVGLSKIRKRLAAGK